MLKIRFGREPTQKEMEKYLRAQGWQFGYTDDHFWRTRVAVDYVSNRGRSLYHMHDAYRLAKRREAQAERRKLKAAGWFWRSRPRFGGMHAGWVHASHNGRFAKTAALAQLERKA